MKTLFVAIAGSAILAIPVFAQTPDAPHQMLLEETPLPDPEGEDAREYRFLEESQQLFPLKNARRKSLPVRKTATPNSEPNSIVLGYAQTYGSSGQYTDFYRWEALTHVASTFIRFDSNGNIENPSTWSGRDSNLRAGGAAEAAGVKVLMTILNTGFDVSVINTVMSSPSARGNLVNNIVSLLQNDGYSHGVTFDFEPFSWNSAATDGMALFLQELRGDLDAAGLTGHEISIYSDPTPNDTQWKVSEIAPWLDYMLYSGYDYATGLTPRAITDHNSTIPQMDFYFDDGGTATPDDGIPPEKFVYVISSYSRRWTGTTSYGVAGSFQNAQGFTDALYDTTLNPNNGGPYFNNYVTGDEAGWYTYNNGSSRTVTWDSPESLTLKIGSSLAYDGTGTYAGRRLAGVGFWSLLWMNETSSWDPISSSSAGKSRTYPHIYQICQELRAPAGQKNFVVAGFEGLNFRWRDPNEGPDDFGDTDNNSTRAIVSAPGGPGRPLNTTNAMQIGFDFEASGRLFFRHELLASNNAPSVMDTNAVAALFDTTTELETSVHTNTSHANVTIRMVVMDADRQLEMSPAFSLSGTGWRTITWDLTESVNAYTTSEPAFNNGNGVLNTAGSGAKDIAFVGFLIESTSSVNGAVVLDEITYRHANADGLNYTINEVRYDGSAGEFVEIFGPAGPFPAGFQLILIDGTTGTRTPVTVTGTVPDDGSGFGYYVIGDPSVANVDRTTGFSDASGNITDSSPSAVQLYNSTNGGVYDSLVYEAFGGLNELLRIQQLGVIEEGAPWTGRVGPGTNSAGEKSSIGRYPDGHDTQINHKDFTLLNPSPGEANGNTVDISNGAVLFDFSTAPSGITQTFQAFDVTSSGVGASPSGGNVYRCVDTTGGGVMTFFGDKSLGHEGGYRVTGEIYLPGPAEPAQAVAIGICGTQGSAFFSPLRSGNSYENGYMLIYENRSGVGLDDGRPDHAGVIEFVHATHDNQDGLPVEFLGSSAAVAPGDWTTFELVIDPEAAINEQLVARIGATTVYSGAIPAGGPTSGAFTVGFRENHSGTPASNEGTWVDNLRIEQIGEVNIPLDGFAIR